VSAPTHKLPRIALFGHGIVGQEALRVLGGMDLEVAAIFAHSAAPGDWQPSLAGDAKTLNIPCFVDTPLSAPETAVQMAALKLDLMVSAYCRELIPQDLLDSARFGGINLHGSPLPKYRGRAPVNWMVLHGETEGGAALHVMTRRADRGALLGVSRFIIGANDTGYDVLLNVRRAGANLLKEHLPAYLAGELEPVPQGSGTIFGRRTPADGRIDWTWPATRIRNLVRAVTRPYPGAFADLDGVRVTVWWVELRPDVTLSAGTKSEDGKKLLVGTGSCALELVDYHVDDEPGGIES
jgi:methionyl-tRNA formyltransferase